MCVPGRETVWINKTFLMCPACFEGIMPGTLLNNWSVCVLQQQDTKGRVVAGVYSPIQNVTWNPYKHCISSIYAATAGGWAMLSATSMVLTYRSSHTRAEITCGSPRGQSPDVAMVLLGSAASLPLLILHFLLHFYF